jgi:hypothetical protein
LDFRLWLNAVKHSNSLCVSATLEFRIKPAFYYELGKLNSYNARTKGENVSIVMLTGECRRIRLTAHYRSYTSYAVCGE